MTKARKMGPADLFCRVIDSLTGLSVLSLVIMMVVTFVSVIMRYIFNAPLLGNNEIVQLMAVSLVMLAMPFATQTEAHVRVDVLDAHIGRYGRFTGDLLARCLAGFVLASLLHRTWFKLLDTLTYGDATNMLRIPIWPFYGFILLGMGLYLLLLVIQVIGVLRKGPRHEL